MNSGAQDFLSVFEANLPAIDAEVSRELAENAALAPLVKNMSPERLVRLTESRREGIRRALAGDWTTLE